MREAFLQAAVELGGRQPWEVFYAAPSVTATAFLQAAAQQADTAAGRHKTPAAAHLLDLATLAHATQACNSAYLAPATSYTSGQQLTLSILADRLCRWGWHTRVDQSMPIHVMQPLQKDHYVQRVPANDKPTAASVPDVAHMCDVQTSSHKSMSRKTMINATLACRRNRARELQRSEAARHSHRAIP